MVVFLVEAGTGAARRETELRRKLVTDTKGRRSLVKSSGILKYLHERPSIQEDCISREGGFGFETLMYIIRVSTFNTQIHTSSRIALYFLSFLISV